MKIMKKVLLGLSILSTGAGAQTFPVNNLQVNGTSSHAGAATFASSVTASGAATFNGSAAFNSAATLSGATTFPTGSATFTVVPTFSGGALLQGLGNITYSNPALYINDTSGVNQTNLLFKNTGNSIWGFSTFSSSNQFNINRYNPANGTYIDTPVAFTSSTGLMNVNDGLDSHSAVTIDSVSSGSSLTINGSGNTTQGAQIALIGDGGVTPNKYVRAKSGTFAVLNSANSSNILTIDDSGNLTVPGTITSAASNTGTPLRVGSSLYPNITAAISTTANTTSGSPNFTVANAAGITTGMGVYASWASSCSSAYAAFMGVYVTNVSGTNITVNCNATATTSGSAVQFGQNRYDANSAILTNDIGTQTLKVGAASQGNSTWLNQISTGQDFRFTSAEQIIPPPGGGYGLTIGARSSDATGGAAAFPFQSLLYLDTWGNTSYGSENMYLQDTLGPSTAGHGPHIQMEQSVDSLWGSPPAEDPYLQNQTNQTISHRYDCGTGQTGSPFPNNCTTAIDITTNPQSFLNGMVFANNAIQVNAGFGNGIAFPTSVGLIWYSAANTYAATIASKGAGQLNFNFPSGSTAGLVLNNALTFGSNAPTISSGFGTGPTVGPANGTAAFVVHVGSSPGGNGVLGMPTANNGWICDGSDASQANATQFYLRQTASTTTSVTMTIFNTAGAASSFVAGDFLNIKCTGY